ncbi:GrBNV gp13-like protein-like protein [Mauternbach virus]|uniref:GrBNV gp13-like protein-like protein n=1 Tax=Mauternbach virus TaxID=2486603 RepID=A0A3G3E619_9VIRU|nr:GrBNV gp13-like protein-like protein [Mauternbach virus]AYP97916.1 GrBNV gp13-like protein-like protein [Mauternbach virus]
MSENQKRSLIERTLYPSKRKLGVDRFSRNIRKNGRKSKIDDSKDLNRKINLKASVNKYRFATGSANTKVPDNDNYTNVDDDDNDDDDEDDNNNNTNDEYVDDDTDAVAVTNRNENEDCDENFECDDDDDDCDDGCDDDDDMRNNGNRQTSGFNIMHDTRDGQPSLSHSILANNRNAIGNELPSVIKLPGGSAMPMAIKNVSTNMGEVPIEYVKYIRDYMDILFSSVAFEANSLIQMDKMESILAVPGIVNAILEYNNISFINIKYCKTTIDLFEPIWYSYNIAKSELILYFNDALYDRFCMESDDKPVLFTSGVIPIDLLNPYENDPNHDTIDSAMIHAAIAADHVAQHIISDIYQPNKPQCASIHDKFTDYGTTLTSIFFIEQNSISMPKREYNNYMTMTMNYPTMMNNNNYGSLNSTQNLLNTFLTPQQNSNHLNQQPAQACNDNNSMPTFRYTV